MSQERRWHTIESASNSWLKFCADVVDLFFCMAGALFLRRS
jgi:hypothetical protein